jgi:hypothetical protein
MELWYDAALWRDSLLLDESSLQGSSSFCEETVSRRWRDSYYFEFNHVPVQLDVVRPTVCAAVMVPAAEARLIARRVSV